MNKEPLDLEPIKAQMKTMKDTGLIGDYMILPAFKMHIPALIAEVERLRVVEAERDRLRAALQAICCR